MRRRSHFEFEDDAVTGINVAPLVDVCLVLVIIFMVTTPLLSRPIFDVKLPSAKTKEGREEDKVTVSLSADGRMAVDAKECKGLEEVSQQLKIAIYGTDSKLVIIRADQDATHRELTELMARAKEAGAQSLTVATEQKR